MTTLVIDLDASAALLTELRSDPRYAKPIVSTSRRVCPRGTDQRLARVAFPPDARLRVMRPAQGADQSSLRPPRGYRRPTDKD